MSAAKREILRRIREANPGAAAVEEPRREYRQSGDASIEALAEKLRDYNAGVSVCGAGEIAATIRFVMEQRGKSSLLIPEGLPAEWLPGELSFVVDRRLTYEAIDRSEGALTGCTAAIASTGTIMVCHSATEGRRALTLIPDYHLCVVLSDQIVGSVPEGVRAVSQFDRSPVTMISGPSATADIEMIRVKGVHGPRTLDVVLVART
ncbi:MAG TPA: LUD domain-containing protein [Bryobacteraceae bacterium]|nr:LUD domain-containing protein [Bryobacteraceae bacterium]